MGRDLEDEVQTLEGGVIVLVHGSERVGGDHAVTRLLRQPVHAHPYLYRLRLLPRLHSNCVLLVTARQATANGTAHLLCRACSQTTAHVEAPSTSIIVPLSGQRVVRQTPNIMDLAQQ